MAISNKITELLGKTFGDRAKESRISPDLKGKTIVIYGGNNVGKTTQASKFKNPIFMPFEKGMNAISGAVVLQNSSWADVKRNITTLSSNQWKTMLKEEEQITVIWDGFERAGFYCQKYIEQKYDAFDIAEAKGGFGAWKQYEKEFWTEVDKLLAIGYTVVFIGHEALNKKKGDKFFPKGDDRCVSPIVDNADVVVYVRANGVDENGEEIMSSGYLVETDDFFGRCRFPYVEKYIEEFSADNLEKEIVKGIKKQLKEEGIEAATYEEQQEIYQGEEVSHTDVLAQIKSLCLKCKELEILGFYEEVSAKHLGEGVKVSETSQKQIEPLICIREELQAKINEMLEEN